MVKQLFFSQAIEKKCIPVLLLCFAFAIPVSTALTTGTMLAIGLLWLLGYETFPQKIGFYYRHPLGIATTAFILLSLLGLLYSQVSLHESTHTLRDYVRLAAIPILAFYLQEKKLQSIVVKAFVVAMILTLVLGYLKVFVHLPIGLKYTMGAVFKSHIKTSYFMAIAAFILSVYGLHTPAHRWWVSLLVLAMIYYLFFLSVGRIGHISLLVLILYVAWHRWRIKGLWIGFVGIFLLFALMYSHSEVFSNRINLLKQDWVFYQERNLEASSLGSRIEFYKTSLAVFAEHPWIGIGTGGFEKAYELYHSGSNILLTDNPHNQYLKAMVELGMLGLFNLMALFYLQWRYSGLLSSERSLLIRGCLLSFYIGCLLNSWLSDFTESYFYVLLSALIFAQFSMKKDVIEHRPFKNLAVKTLS
ncbi:O-antigen ligase family protein [Candidatus Berkiella cookevillensis]|uniref:O-Antigen ligase n=1 Tax=Candidatus Berkiella cookevillensis TaxID=437022 RepID=A0A0Q9YSL1_9GAMM|nr:O-antigen ligase family protein [Candidatus Berkiella cookevillensis]MCS5707518.1 O-antigen ligase family protein [Candidatus Berkiella cookevillensis]